MASNIWHAGLICVSPASWPDCGKVRSSWMRSGGGIGSSVKHCDITCMAGSSNHPFDSTPPETQSPVVPSRVTQRTAQPTAGFRFIMCTLRTRASSRRLWLGMGASRSGRPTTLHFGAWNYVTLGRGHDAAWWGAFCGALAAIGYDDFLSIEHEDLALPPIDGVRQSVAL